MSFKKSSLSSLSLLLVASLASANDSVVFVNDDPRLQSNASKSLESPDIQNATAMPLPVVSEDLIGAPDPANSIDVQQNFGQPGGQRGSMGNGKLVPVRGVKGKTPKIDTADEDPSSMEFGTFNHPYTTRRVDGYGNRNSREYPYRPTGKLYFKVGNRTGQCSASLIKKGVLVTAAHCVWAWGRGNYRSFVFQPAKYDGSMPFGGSWNAYRPTVMASYAKGTPSNCRVAGVICDNDIAVLRVQPKKIGSRYYYPGQLTGWYGYGWNGYGFTRGTNSKLGKSLTNVDQLGYPVSHDRGWRMQQNSSIGYIDGNLKNNTIIGSRMTGGSSGGPWLVNHGSASTLRGTNIGSHAGRNRVVGVTSWGYVSSGPKVHGASAFTSSNIVPLMRSICSNYSGC